jgi:hypothetical protein
MSHDHSCASDSDHLFSSIQVSNNDDTIKVLSLPSMEPLDTIYCSVAINYTAVRVCFWVVSHTKSPPFRNILASFRQASFGFHNGTGEQGRCFGAIFRQTLSDCLTQFAPS